MNIYANGFVRLVRDSWKGTKGVPTVSGSVAASVAAWKNHIDLYLCKTHQASVSALINASADAPYGYT